MNHLCSPAFSEKTADSPAKNLEAVSSRPANQIDGFHTIGFVDDDESDRTLVSRILGNSGEFRSVGLYSSAEEALREIPRGSAQVVLMDIRMPGISGLECARLLRNIRPDLIIIMISGFDHANIPTQALAAGADAYLIKPFSLCRFSEILREVLRRRNLGVHGRQAPSPTRSVHQGSLTEEANIREALHRLVIRMEKNPETQEDLFQEACLYFWTREQHYPGQRLSWYLQGAKLHLQNLRIHGRSLDSPKRRGAQASFPDHFDAWNHLRDRLEFDDGIMSEVNAQDVFYLLVDRLEPKDQRILEELAQGEGIRDIAGHIQTSHQSVLSGRKRIAALAIKLGVVAPTRSPNRDGVFQASVR